MIRCNMKRIFIILFICLFLFGCKKEEVNNKGYDDIINEFQDRYDSNNYVSLFYLYYDIDNNDTDELVLLGYNEIEYKIIDIYYMNGNNAEELIDNKYYSDISKVDIYDNGMLFIYNYNSYEDGEYLIYKMNNNKIDEVAKYYFKYITDDEYFIYDDKEYSKESEYLSVNDLLNEYIKNGNKINLKSLDLKGI